MKKITIISFLILPFALLTLSSTSPGVKKNNKVKASELCQQGVSAIDKGEYKKAIDLLSQAQALDPAPFDYPYEKALAYYQNKEYDTAIKILDSLKSHPGVNDHLFQLLGNSYGNTKQNAKAIETYQEGLIKFPNSGRLYMELGLAELETKKAHDVIYNWENGVRFDPSYPNNYYYLAKYFTTTGEKLWTLFYGEIFAQISENRKGLEENSRTIFDAYISSMFSAKDSTLDIKFTRVVKHTFSASNGADKAYDTFEMAFQNTMEKSARDVLKPGSRQVDLSQLNTIRTNFVKTWFSEKLNERFPNIVLDRQKQLLDNNLLEAYNYWLLQKGSPDEFNSWRKKESKQFQAFLKWTQENPFVLDSAHTFYRFQYQ